MKEATGELSTTVIAIVAIAAILAIFTAFLLPTLKGQIALSQACAGGPGYKTEKVCCNSGGTGGQDSCGDYKQGGQEKTCDGNNNSQKAGTSFTCWAKKE